MKPEFRVFIREQCLINPVPKPRARAASFAALFLPKLIEVGIGGVASLLKRAGADETEQVSGGDVVHLYETDEEQKLDINRELGCVLGLYGVFDDVDDENTKFDDAALKKLEAENFVAPNSDISIIFEAAIVPTPDRTAFYLEVRHFSVRTFLGDRRKSDRAYVATISVTTPSASADGTTIALGNISLGRMGKESLKIPDGQALGTFPRYRTNLMPWARITKEAKETYDSDVKQGTAKNKAYMPTTLTLTITETADGNAFLAKLGELLEGSKDDIAKGLGDVFDPGKREESMKAEADAVEKLYAAEEDALIKVKEAEAALAKAPDQKEVLTAKLAKARRALDVAVRLRKAAGLADLA